jgi:hypothetical protein
MKQQNKQQRFTFVKSSLHTQTTILRSPKKKITIITMKISLIALASVVSTASAFMVGVAPPVIIYSTAPSTTTTTTQLQAARADASVAIKAALDASKKYGATSPEARVAWATVEEIDSSDNR